MTATPTRPWHRRLVAKIVTGVVAAILLIELVLLVPSLVAQRRHLREVRMTTAEVLAHGLYQPVAEALAAGDRERLMRIHESAARRPSVSMVTLSDVRRITIACSVRPHVGLTNDSLAAEVALTAGAPAGVWIEDQGAYRYALPVNRATGEPMGVLEVSVDVSDIPAELVAYALRTFGLVGIILLFTSTVLGVYLYRIVIRPVTRIVRANTAAARRDGANAYVPAGEIPDDELGDIARTRNEMLAVIEEHAQDLEAVIFRGIADPISLLDANRRVLLRNRAPGPPAPSTAAERTSAPACGCEVHRALPALPLDGCPVGRSLATGTSASLAFSVADAAGTRHFEAFTFPLDDEPQTGVPPAAGTRPGRKVIEHVRDMTERRQLEDRARRHERLAVVGELAAGMAHEIRNPLASIVASADLLDVTPGESMDEEGKALLGVLKKEARRISRLLSDFLQFARPRPLRLASTSLNALVQNVAALVRTQTKNGSRVVIREGLDPSLPPVEVDPDLLQQALLNIAINGLEAMPDGGELTLTTGRAPADVYVAVTDTGVGMKEEEQGRIFEPFHTTKADGTGLGLAIVHRIVEAHGGAITVDSRPGKGSTFRLEIPLRSPRRGGDHGAEHDSRR